MADASAIVQAMPELLARPPVRPRDPNLFSSNSLFGQPGIYPDGSRMEPATGPAPTDDEARALLATVLHARVGANASGDAALARFDDPELVAAVPDGVIRAGLLCLAGTVGAPILDAFPDGTTASRLAFGVPAAPGRIVGPAENDGEDTDSGVRVVNVRYRAEHPALLAGSLAHDLLWTPETTGHATEAFLHALVAMIHVQLVASRPELAHLGTELCRRQNSLAITLLNSRPSGSMGIALLAPTGPGTIPGGAPAMQSPDFWSIPFGPVRSDQPPPLLARVIDELVPPAVPRPEPLCFDEALGSWLSEHADRRWLPPFDQLEASIALGLIDPAMIADAAGCTPTEAIAVLGLEHAAAEWAATD